MEPLDRLAKLSSDFGFPLDTDQLESLDVYREWLAGEAVEAGGIGPNEVSQLFERHLADALTFLQPLDWTPETVLDVGSGVGLPGIPLAIALPETRFTLLDRSGRRCRLLRRAIRVLNRSNVVVEQRDVTQMDVGAEVVVSRASLPPDQLLPHLRRLAGRMAIVSGSTTNRLEIPGYTTIEIESRYLESHRWLLIMQSS